MILLILAIEYLFATKKKKEQRDSRLENMRVHAHESRAVESAKRRDSGLAT